MARAVDTATLPHPTIIESLRFIAEGLRPADQAELRASLGDAADPFHALVESYGLSTKSWLILDRTGLPIGIMGVAPHGVPNLGIAWMMGTPGVEDEALSIARQTGGYVEQMHDDFPFLLAVVDVRNELSMRWLEWSGFSITDARPRHGAEDRLFLEYTRTPAHV